jgi:hypothetical protein
MRPSRILGLAFNGLCDCAAGQANELAHRLKVVVTLPATNDGNSDLCSGLDGALEAACKLKKQ